MRMPLDKYILIKFCESSFYLCASLLNKKYETIHYRNINLEAMISCTKEVGAAEGIFPAPEGAACYAALKDLLASGAVRRDETIVLFNTSTGLKYLECYTS